MGYYEQPQRDDQPPGCLDTLLIIRVVFGLLFWPLVVLLVVLLDAGVTWYLFTSRAPLALIPVALTAFGVWLYARWEQKKFRPPDL